MSPGASAARATFAFVKIHRTFAYTLVAVA